MKISNLFEWISDNFGNIVVTIVIVGFASTLIYGMAHIKPFPVGCDVRVKNTEIRGTVTKNDGENVEISVVNPDGTVKTLTYNVHLLTR